MNYINTFLKLFLFSIAFLTLFPVIAQGTPPGTPIDGGLSALLVAGGVYGAKKLYDKRR